MYAFPPVSLLGKVISKLSDHLCQRVILIAPGWPNMLWFWDLVDLSAQITICLPNLPDLVIQPQGSSQSQPSHLAPRAEAIKEQGFSSPVVLRIDAQPEQSMRQSGPWCEASQVDFRSPSAKQIADFLLYLFQEKNFKPSIINGYRSAIADKLCNASLNGSKGENLNHLLDSFHRDRPLGTSPWFCINLQNPPFEPLRKASLIHLTFKTVFLLAPGSGKCRSEIRTSVTKLIGQKCLCILFQVFWLRTTW